MRAALDIGGANIKASRLSGPSFTRPFALWKEPERLAEVLGELLARLAFFDRLAVTMSGELCDCFADRAGGVRHILESVLQAAASRSIAAPVEVWRLDGTLVSIDEALERPLLAAAANWLALATWAAPLAGEGAALLVDIGSTTCDIVRLEGGRPRPIGLTDSERLQTGELVYSGASRTPVCALVREVPYRGAPCRVAAELFATTLDVHLVLGDIEERPEERGTADGREATRERAIARLGRMVCADPASFSAEEARELAAAVAAAQLEGLERGLAQVLAAGGAPPRCAVISGSGEFLGRRLAGRARIPRLLSLSEHAGAAASAAACAYALAHLAGR
jgi:probable H4MPT-linked C1 transfer pathway protein